MIEELKPYWNYDNFSKWNTKSNKIYRFWKSHIYSTTTNMNMWYIEATMCIFNNKLQNISFKNFVIWKNEND
jgi:hypothetical protein